MTKPQPRPATRAGRVLTELESLPDGATGAELARRLGVRPQSVNGVCRQLADQGHITRFKTNGALINRLSPAGASASAAVATTRDVAKPWFWEGNVQATLVEALADRGWTITWQADTASHQHGKDVEAERDGEVLWVTVKGFPAGTAKTRPTVQARHWFSHAFFDVIRWRDESRDVRIAVALPDKPRYRNLAKQTTWFQRAAAFHILWVTEQGDVQGVANTWNNAPSMS